jgi:23S rRNA (adenine2503-C2)-methyltransferase
VTEPAIVPGETDLKGLLPGQLADLVSRLGEPAYRAEQLFSWIHDKGVSDLDAMTNLPKRLRQRLAEEGAFLTNLPRLERHDSATGMAVKCLFGIPGPSGPAGAGQVEAGQVEAGQVEAVLIVDGDRRTACLSSQVGCALDCRFCATGRMGFRRNLGAGQIVDQLLQLQAIAAEAGDRVTNIVMMGMGEPLLNYDEVTQALRILRHAEGAGIGGRRITVSTAGYLPGIRRLIDDDLNVGLAISLNATKDEVRTELMPVNGKWPIVDLLQAARDYFERKGRRVTFEYVLMAGVTDADADAARLAALTRDVACKINVIPYNELGDEGAVSGRPVFRRPGRKRIDAFLTALRGATTNTVTLRESRGRDIAAACGQLYREPPPRPAAAVA